jgi:hypothetical protein
MPTPTNWIHTLAKCRRYACIPKKRRGEKKEERTILSVKKEQEDLWTLALASRFGRSKITSDGLKS